MQSVQREHFRHKLQSLRNQTQAVLGDLRQDLAQPLSGSIGELSTYDNHPSDVATETYERAKDLGLEADQKRLLKEIDDALQRLDEGIYGWCANCGRAIPKERLEALPYAKYCLPCQEHGEKQEPILSDPLLLDELYRESFTDGQANENVAFDGEDSWQAVARYGTSNTPGDFRQVEDYSQTYIDHDEARGIVWEEEAFPLSYDRSSGHFLSQISPKKKKSPPKDENGAKAE